MFEAEFSELEPPSISVQTTKAPLAYFLLRLIARLQTMATVPCLDMMAYARWLNAEGTS